MRRPEKGRGSAEMGKSSIIYVIGLALLLGYALMMISATSTSSMDNYTAYYGRSMAHNIAITGANIGTQLIMRTPTYTGDLLNQSYAGGTFNMYIERPGGDSAWVKCYSRIDVSGETIRDTVIACLRFTSLCKYGWFTEAERNGYGGSPFYGANDWKITGDSVFGPAHTNWKFNLAGSPYFHDKVTATNSPTAIAMLGVRNPIFRSGYQWGITVTRPPGNLNNLVSLASDDGMLFSNTDVGLTFMGDQVAVKIPPSTGTMRNDTVAISTLAPNGVITVFNGDMRVKGTYRGKITLATHNDGTAPTKGNVWLDGTGIRAQDDPRYNPGSQDMMGIVSNNHVYISQDLSRNSSTVFDIIASVYCQNGELTAESFWNIPISGRVNLYGGVQQKSAGSLGVFNPGAGMLHGFFYSVRFDDRLSHGMTPLGYPVSSKYELVSWWEN